MPDPRARLLITAERAGEQAFRSMDSDLKALKTSAELVGIGAAAALVALTKSSFESIDSLAKTSDQLGITTQALSSMRIAAGLAGVGQDELETNLRKMSKSVAEAAHGVGTAKDAFGQLGLKAADLMKMPLDQQFRAVAAAIDAVPNANERARLSVEIFSRTGSQLLSLMHDGGNALDEAAAFAEKFGLNVSRIDAAKIELVNDNASLVMQAFHGLGNIIAVEVSPLIAQMSTDFLTSGINAKTMHADVKQALDKILEGVGWVANAFYGWRLIFAYVKVGVLELASNIVLMGSWAIDAANGIRNAWNDAWAWIAKADAAIKNTLAPGSVTLDDIARIDAANAQHTDNVLRDIAESLRASSIDADRLASELAAAGLPSQKVAEWVERARVATEGLAAARAKAAQAQKNDGGVLPPTDTENEKARRAREAAQRAMREVETALRTGLQNELDMRREYGQLTIAQETQIRATLAASNAAIERLALKDRLDKLREGLTQGVITQQEFEAMSIEAARQTQDRITGITRTGLSQREKFEQMSARNKAKTVIDSMVEMTAGVAQTSRTMFAINKALSLASAVMNTAQGVTKALAEYPPPFSFIMAGMVAAAGLAQIQAIRQTSFGGGTTPSLAGTTGSVGGQPVSTSGQPSSLAMAGSRGGTTVNVTIQGSVIGEGGRAALAEDLARILRDHVERTDDTLVSVTSRNGMDLVGAPA